MTEKATHDTRFVRLAVGLAAAALLACSALAGCSGDNTETPPTTPSVDASADASADGSSSCATGLNSCGGACVNTKTSNANCGACGAACDTGLVCSGGKCAIDCDGGTKCPGGCYDLTSDPMHCGACGTKCPAGQACVAGACAVACSGGTTKCNAAADGGAACVDLDVDPANCGTCGAKCPAGQVCSAGKCALGCAAGLTRCGLADAGADAGDGGAAYCANTSFDNHNCGACGKACAPGQACDDGACSYTCKAGLVVCGGACVDPNSDGQHCGATAGCGQDAGSPGMACPAGKACNGGACVPWCQAGQVACNGSCVDPTSSRQYCGANAGCGQDGGTAGTVCKAGEVCTGGTCQLSCQPGLVNCGGTCLDPSSDRQHCGATAGCGENDAGLAGTMCAAGQVCSLGACADSCQQSLVNCAGKCIDPTTDREHCGATNGCGEDAGSAGTPCVGGQVCSAGVCRLSCQQGLVDCGGKCIDPSIDRQHCGATLGCGADGGTAGTPCADGQVCSGGACQASCQAGLVACGGVCIDPTTNNQFCGATPGCGVGDAGGAGTACVAGQTCFQSQCRNTRCSKNLTQSAIPNYVTATTSGGNGAPALMIDGVGKTACGTSSFTYVSNSPFAGNGSWIQLDWSELQDIDSFYLQTDDGAQFVGGDLSQANDGLGVCWSNPVPPGARNIEAATVQWWDYSLNGGAGDWADAGTFSGQSGNVQFNFPARVNTTRIRLLDLQTSWADGYGGNSVIWEWHVYSALNCQPTP
jgi:Stigma-specific protein, Stig1